MSARNRNSHNLFWQVLRSNYNTIPYIYSLKIQSRDVGYQFHCVINQLWNVQLPTRCNAIVLCADEERKPNPQSYVSHHKCVQHLIIIQRKNLESGKFMRRWQIHTTVSFWCKAQRLHLEKACSQYASTACKKRFTSGSLP